MSKSQSGVAHLTAKQEKFVNCLVEGKSQREAYKECYSTKNMKDKTIDENASRVFKNSKVLARYKQLMEEAAKASKLKAEDLIKMYETICTASPFDFIELLYGPEGYYSVMREDIDPSKKVALKKISFDRQGNVIVDLWDKMAALEKLSQIHKLVDSQNTEEEGAKLLLDDVAGDYLG